MMKSTYALGLVAVLLLGGCGDNAAQHSALPPGIGDVDVVVRLVHGTLANQDERRTLEVQDAVYWRELIETGQESATQVEFTDGTRLTVGADAKVNLDEFVYGGPPGTDRMVMTVTKGMSRFVTGNMDKAAYEIRAPGAIIGVRGTEFTLVVDPDAETTLCVVHRGEVEMRRPDGGESVVVQPGKASTASSKAQGWITPAEPPPSDIIRTSDSLRSAVDAAKEEQRIARADDHRRETVTDAERGVSTQSMRRQYGRQRLQDIAQQLRTPDNSQQDQGGSETAAKGAVVTAAAQPAKAATGKSAAAGQTSSTHPGPANDSSGGGDQMVAVISASQLVKQPEPEEAAPPVKAESTPTDDQSSPAKPVAETEPQKVSQSPIVDDKPSAPSPTPTGQPLAPSSVGDPGFNPAPSCEVVGSCATPRPDVNASPVVSRSRIGNGG